MPPKKTKVSQVIQIVIPAGTTAPTSAIGSALGQAGVNIMEFLKAFGVQTGKMEKDTPIPVVITVFANKTFSFVCKLPPVSYYLKKALKIKKGSGVPNKDKVGSLSDKQLTSIAKEKMPDLNTDSLDMAKRIVAGTAKSMGIDIQ